MWRFLPMLAVAVTASAAPPALVVSADHLSLTRVGHCLVPARGTTRGTPICAPTRPLTIVAERSRFAGAPATSIVGVLGPHVASVVVAWRADGRRLLANQELRGDAPLLAFGGSFRGRSIDVIAIDAGGRRIAELAVTPKR